MSTPTKEQIEDVLSQCVDALDEGSRWPGMSYEQGVEAAIRWMQGDSSNPMEG